MGLADLSGEALARSIRSLGEQVGAPDGLVTGTLFWYSLSGALARAALLQGVDLADPGLEVRPGPGGWPQAVTARPGGPNLSCLPDPIPEIAAVSGARERALWALATDSVANAALEAGLDPAAVVAALGPGAPPPRTATVGGRRVIRRGSCCLIYLCPGMSKCASCPRQPPEERIERIARIG